tara:strand:- start:359 stop:616 length:258 start_codon:yes stop_codon:yes gene_type:complete
MNAEWVKVSGKGKVFSWVVVRQGSPSFAGDVPYVVASVQLAEQDDLRMFGNIEGCAPEDIELDMPVEVFFDEVTEEVSLPKWKPA